MASAWSTSLYNRGLGPGADPAAGSRDRAPGGWSGAIAFRLFSYKKGPKVPGAATRFAHTWICLWF